MSSRNGVVGCDFNHASRATPIAIAPAPNGRPTPQVDDKPSMPHTCVNCARRKVKCDKSGPPCSTCRRTKAECVYQAPSTTRRKRKLSESLHERLERYERLLKENNLLSDSDADSKRLTSKNEVELRPGDSSNEEPPLPSRGKLVSGSEGTRYIDSALWKILPAAGEENPLHDEAESDLDQQSGSHGLSQDSMSATFFGVALPPQSLIQFHPTYEAAIAMWRVYVDGVEPIIRVLHKPTTAAMLERVAANPSIASRSTECLVFATYHFAVIAMQDDECMELLGQARSELLVKYHDALRYALINADFLRSTDIQVMQAFVMLLLAVRVRYDPHLFWMLTGVAIRMAQRMGLHQDGELIGRSPFETEVNRRIFWQLPQLDVLAGQLCGTGINIEAGSWDVKHPLNINDEDMWPGMKEPPKEHKGATEMIFYLTRAEVGKFYAKIKSILSALVRAAKSGDQTLIEESEQQIDELESKIETRFLRYCDPMDTLHIMNLILARAAMRALRLRVRLPRAKAGFADSKEKEQLYKLAIQIMDHSIAVYNNPALSKYLWHTRAFFVWDALIWILSELRQGSPTGEAESAWSRFATLFACHPDLLAPTRPLAVAVTKLVLTTWDTRPTQSTINIDDPSFISNARAALKTRFASRRSNMASPAPGYNASRMSNDFPSNVPILPNTNGSGTLVTTDFDNKIDADNFDWEFWDQLLKDPDLLRS